MRNAAVAMLPELEAVATQRGKWQPLQEELNEFKEMVKTESAGPAWPRELVGDEPMAVFDWFTGSPEAIARLKKALPTLEVIQ